MAKRSSSDFIDIKGLFKSYVSKWYLFLISVLVCGGLAFFYTKVHQPVYVVRANVLITQNDDAGGGALAAMTAQMGSLGSIFGSDGYVEDEIFIVSSHSLYREVARELGLNVTYGERMGFMDTRQCYPETPIRVNMNPSICDTLRVGIDFKLKINDEGKTKIVAKVDRQTVAEVKDVTLPYTVATPYGKFTFVPTETFIKGEDLTMRINVKSYDAAAEQLDEDIHTEIASKRSNVISLSVDTPVPVLGEDILNAILREYNTRGIAEKSAQGELTAKFIEERLGLMAEDLAGVEVNIQHFKQNNSIIDLETEAKYQTEKRAAIEGKLIDAQTQLEIAKITYEFITDPSNAYSMIPATVSNEGIQNAIAQYNTLIMEYAKTKESARSDNSTLRLLRQNIDMMRGNIHSSLDRLLKSTQVAVRELQHEINLSDNSLKGVPATERQYIDLQRQQRVKSELYLLLLKHREENSMMMANATPKGQIIDSAFRMSEPLGLGNKMILLFGLILGMCIPPVYLYLRKLINNRFETRADVERITEVPILGELCLDKSGQKLVVSDNSTSTMAELVRLIRTNLMFVLNGKWDKVVLLTSSTSGEGKSFIAINLAASLSLLGKRTLLVGMDIRNPRLSQYLDIHPRFGLTQFLSSSDIKLQDIIVPVPNIQGLDTIVAGPVPPNPGELLLSEKVDQMFSELREMYDFIIVDTAPIGQVSDTFTLDRVADASIYVCRANYTNIHDLEAINEIYEQSRLKKLSIVINGTAAKKTYGYGTRK